MHHQLASKPGSRFSWLALLCGAGFALTSQACSVDKSKYTFNDDEYNNATNGGGANPNGGGANPNGGGANPNGGGANPNGGDSGANSDAGTGGEPGTPPADCTVGEHFCTNDGHLLTCQAGTPPAFDKGIACSDADHCSETQGKCLKCAPGEFQCVNASLQQCNIFGSAFEDTEVCDTKAACIANGQKGFCVRCKPSTGSCESALVAPSIADNGPVLTTTRLLNCNIDGSGTDTQQVCEADQESCNGTSKSCTKCTPGAFVCDGNTLNICTADGMSYTLKQTCNSGKQCDQVNGQCTAPPDNCVLGNMKCVGDTLEACDDNGKYVQIDSCGAGLCDAGEGKCKQCASSQSACSQGNQQYCDGNTGVLFTAGACNGGSCALVNNNASCTAGYQVNSILCYEGAPSYTLFGAGGQQTAKSCPQGQVCNPLAVLDTTRPPCVTCTPNTYTCDNNNTLSRCAADGSGLAVVENCGLTHKSCNQFIGACLPGQIGQYACTATGDLQQVVYAADHSVVLAPTESGDSCGSNNMCQQYGASCRKSQCLVGMPTCQNGDVYSCDTGDGRHRTGEHCATTTRCQDGFGCVKAVAIAAGDAHTCAIVAGPDAKDGDDGIVLCWGANESGQLGNGSPLLADQKEARQVLVSQNDKNSTSTMNQLFVRPFFSGLCAGKDFTCADVNADQPGVACWGSNVNGQLGADTADPGPFNGPFDLVQAAGQATDKGLYLSNATCGAEFACALGPDGSAWCWGANDAGQLGNSSAGTASNGATKIDGHLFTQLTAGARHVCGVKADNSVWCWGSGAQGQLGTGDTKGSALPVMIDMLTAPGDRPLALGNDFTLALGTNDAKSPSSWGANLFGQLGNGTNGDAPTPGPLSGLTTAAIGLTGTLYSGSTAEHACVRIGGTLQCWGANVFGEIGNNSTTDSSNPILILDGKTDPTKVAPGAHSVAVGGRHTCAITAKGDVMCWGANHRSQLGTILPSPQRIPVRAY